MKKLFYLSIVLVPLLLFISCESSLKDYEPKNDTEKSIKELLNTYIDARNNGDITTYTSLFHDNAKYIAGSGGTFTKSQIAKMMPEYWVEWGKIKLLNSEFQIDGNEATVSSMGKWGVHFKTPHVCSLVKEDGKWLIMRVKTGN